MSAARICAAMLLAALAAGCAARQPQRPAVVVLEVRGASGERWQERAAELAEARHFEVIPAETYWVMATRLGARPLTAPNVARVAASVGASAVVHGRVSGKKRRRVVTIYVRAGDTGRVVEKHRVRLRRSGRARGEAALERRLLASLPAAEPPDERDAVPAPAQRTASPAGKAEPAAPARSDSARPPRRGPPPRVGVPRSASAQRPRAGRERAEPAPDAPPPAPVEYDKRGQAIDDEMPSSLSK